MQKFKVGDKVRLTGDLWSIYKGETRVIREVLREGDLVDLVFEEDEEYPWAILNGWEVELVEDTLAEKVAELEERNRVLENRKKLSWDIQKQLQEKVSKLESSNRVLEDRERVLQVTIGVQKETLEELQRSQKADEETIKNLETRVAPSLQVLDDLEQVEKALGLHQSHEPVADRMNKVVEVAGALKGVYDAHMKTEEREYEASQARRSFLACVGVVEEALSGPVPF